MQGLVPDDSTTAVAGCDRRNACFIVSLEAFFADASPYLGQAILGEPVRPSDVFSPNRSCQ
jgi:hypothetical protein